MFGVRVSSLRCNLDLIFIFKCWKVLTSTKRTEGLRYTMWMFKQNFIFLSIPNYKDIHEIHNPIIMITFLFFICQQFKKNIQQALMCSYTRLHLHHIWVFSRCYCFIYRVRTSLTVQSAPLTSSQALTVYSARQFISGSIVLYINSSWYFIA